MHNKIAYALAAVVILIGGYFLISNQDSSAPVSGDYRWEFTSLGEDEAGAPRMQVTLKSGGTVFPAGTYQGSCAVIDGTSWKLLDNEKSGVICWFAGGGKEVGVFQEGDRVVVKVGELDEGSAEVPAFRGNFTELFDLDTRPTSGGSNSDTGKTARIETRIDQGASALGVKIVPLAVLEDSRCAVDVQCIQAGTVRLRAQLVSGLGTATQEFKLGTPVTTEAEEVTLVEVLPAPHSQVQIKPADYRFTFEIKKR